MAQEQTIVLDEDTHYTIIQRKSRHHPPVISKDAGGRPNETEDVAYWRFEAIGKPGEAGARNGLREPHTRRQQ